MFTGIVSAVGSVRAVQPIGQGRDMRLRIGTPPGWLDGVQIGASICCAGCCLTVVEADADSFAVEASAETLSLTGLGGWREGSPVNLERALRMGDELGGHVVSGHVDGRAEVVSVLPENGSTRWTFAVDPSLGRLIAAKGSVTLDGVSLTVNAVRDGVGGGADGGRTEFAVNMIPHTHAHTGFGALAAAGAVGAMVNLEIDMLARYVARLREASA